MSAEGVFSLEHPRQPSRRQRLQGVARMARRSPLGTGAVIFVVALIIVAVAAPLVAPYDPLQFHRIDRLQGPNAHYWLGTDQSGRDQFSRLIYGARVSLYIGMAPIFISAAIGTMLGTISGYWGGPVDLVLQRFADALMCIPALVIALTMVALLGPSLNNVMIAIAVVTIPVLNRVARAATMQVANLPYMDAARALGASNVRLLFRHVLPNIMGPVTVVSASLVGGAILAEAGLSFLGLGIPPPTPTWGNMLSGDNKTVFEVAPWLVIFPGIAIMLTVLAFNLLGDALRDLIDPRTRKSGR